MSSVIVVHKEAIIASLNGAAPDDVEFIDWQNDDRNLYTVQTGYIHIPFSGSFKASIPACIAIFKQVVQDARQREESFPFQLPNGKAIIGLDTIDKPLYGNEGNMFVGYVLCSHQKPSQNSWRIMATFAKALLVDQTLSAEHPLAKLRTHPDFNPKVLCRIQEFL